MRKKRAIRRRVTPDPKFGDELISRFVNSVLQDGKKNIARSIVYDALEQIGQKTEKNPLDIFKKAVDNASPLIEVRARRVGGATYQVPTEVRQNRKQALAIRWIIQYAQERKGKPMEERLAEEIIEASKNQGGAIKKKEDTHKMAEANKAFAHFRW